MIIASVAMPMSIAQTGSLLMNVGGINALRTTPVSGGGAKNSVQSRFGATFATAASIQTTAASGAIQISDQAKAANAKLTDTSGFNKAFFDASAPMTDAQRKDYYTKAADVVSASQGLPSGQYNFHSMTTGEAEVVTNSLKLNGTATVDQMSGLSEMTNITGHDGDGNVVYNNQRHDYTAMLTGQRDYEAAAGNGDGANMMQASLDIISKFQGNIHGAMTNSDAKLDTLLAIGEPKKAA